MMNERPLSSNTDWQNRYEALARNKCFISILPISLSISSGNDDSGPSRDAVTFLSEHTGRHILCSSSTDIDFAGGGP